jgi:hypothetical protein
VPGVESDRTLGIGLWRASVSLKVTGVLFCLTLFYFVLQSAIVNRVSEEMHVESDSAPT